MLGLKLIHVVKGSPVCQYSESNRDYIKNTYVNFLYSIFFHNQKHWLRFRYYVCIQLFKMRFITYPSALAGTDANFSTSSM